MSGVNSAPVERAPEFTGPALQVRNLRKLYPIGGRFFRRAKSNIHAVDDISLDVPAGGSLALVGESGCGKTTAGKLMVKLLDATSGEVRLTHGGGDEIELSSLSGRETKRFRRSAQMIFQDPYESINPRRTVFDTIAEPLVVQRVGNIREREERVLRIMEQVSLTPVASMLMRYPHELSGGQRQRVAIARALVLEPRFVVADEPTSMLDVSVRTGIMMLMLEMRERLNATFVYITHDLAVARYMCDRIAVMYMGKIVEVGETESLLKNPVHPYTRALLSAVPVPDPSVTRSEIQIKGGVARPVDPAPRCRFFDRCLSATEVCETEDHPVLSLREEGRAVACCNF
ncbi:MAG: ATP-binding cassette domain-containing protein [Dehalococcoidia bacterium]|jgi:peptide/nickel transport system ATP-binding protein|nr:ATP-binding cassette domain-containing protein [Dehalococcoidia bacterium]